MTALQFKVIQQVFNHIALPPRLPDHYDSNTGEVNREIVSRAIRAADNLRLLQKHDSNDIYDSLRQSLELCDSTHENGQIDRSQLTQAFSEVEPNTSLILHIAEQNAGLLILPGEANEHGVKEVTIECFEASPIASSVLACTGALNCQYPGTAVAISMDVFKNKSFQESFAKFLEQASGEPIEEFAARAKKAGANVKEPRDTTVPHLISQMLMAFLEAQGYPVAPRRIQKRVRDDVCWSKAYLPWRRSPFYLVIRVCVERLLYARCGPEAGRHYYKLFVCMMHFHLLVDVGRILSFESRHFLLAKLCRRLAKLEVLRKKTKLPAPVIDLHDTCSSKFFNSIKSVAKGMETEWSKFKELIRRRIPSLPGRASNQDTHLQLPNCAPQIERMQLARRRKEKNLVLAPLTASKLDERINQPYRKFAITYHALYHSESQPQRDFATTKTAPTVYVRLSNGVENYLNQISKLFDTSAEEKSVMMLSLFEHWLALDQHIVRQFPLVGEYSSGFLPEALDVLQLASYEDMERLRRIQESLNTRQQRCRFKEKTLFSRPVADSFPDRYVRCSPDALRLAELRDSIVKASQAARAAKEAELARVNKLYRELSCRMESLGCTRQKKAPWSSCSHCKAKRQRRELAITAHEDFLPRDGVPQRAAIFELAMPPALARYRDATWRIIACFGIPESLRAARRSPAKAILDRYVFLQPYMEHHGLKFHMASKAKSFLVSHYKTSALPASTNQVLLPFGLHLEYYDTQDGVWASELPAKITFAHHFGLDSSVLSLISDQGDKFAADGNGRSSYEIVVTQEECPTELTMHEYTTYQSLLTGKSSRWLSLLRELGSSNLNFSLESTMHLVSYLALQAGPNSKGKTLRDIHQVFDDPPFCLQLAAQIENLLSRICSSWREVYCMEMLLTLILRLCNLGSGLARSRGFELVQRVRTITSGWCRKLRFEIQHGVSVEKAQQLSTYALLAGLLCKRTFAASQEDVSKSETLQIFLEACLTIQESIQDPSQLPGTIRGLFIRDLRMSSSMAPCILKALAVQSSSCMRGAIEKAWPDIPNGQRSFGVWRSVQGSEWWKETQVAATEYSREQTVQYHPLEGHLLLDLKPIGRLPSEIRDSPIVQDLFGQEHLMIFPSAMTGMDYTLAGLRNGHQIHFGKINNEIVIQAAVKGSLLRLVDRKYFGAGIQADLPLRLISDCFHWLDMKSRRVDVRRRKHAWMLRRPSNWLLDMRTRHASRGQVLLIDPHSKLFAQVATIFQGFEDVERLTVFQPKIRNLSVELKRMDLDFTVNDTGRLICRQLHAEIDPNQDAGTWYGLQSKLVLRDSANYLQRSVIVPIGALSSTRQGPHVRITALGNGRYGRYQIDSVLGRLKCEPEPVLIYTKSLLHAFTAFPLPDTLTGRTGTEEALSCLTSAMSQPWNSIGPTQAEPLIALAQLTPRRYYYPENKQCQQQVLWNDSLTTTIQHEQYRPLIENMIKKLDRLAKFSLQPGYRLSLGPSGVAYLTHRSHLRRRNFMRSECSLNSCANAEDKVYSSRDKRTRSPRMLQVYEIARALQEATPQFVTTSLVERFDQSAWISGYTKRYQPGSLDDLLELEIVPEWGRLVNLCREYKVGRYDIAFRLATIAFAEKIDLNLLRIVIAFCMLPELKNLHLPTYPEYSSFRFDEKPSRQSVLVEIKQACSAPSDGYNDARLRKKIPKSMTFSEYTQLFESECCSIADRVCGQWPRRDLQVSHISTTTIDVNRVVNLVRLKWVRLAENFAFSQSLLSIQRALDAHNPGSVSPYRLEIKADASSYPIPRRLQWIPDIRSLLLKSGPPGTPLKQEIQSQPFDQLWNESKSLLISRCKENGHHSDESLKTLGEIKSIVQELTTSQSMLRRRYGEDLISSLSSLQSLLTEERPHSDVPTPYASESAIASAQEIVDTGFRAICTSLSKSDFRHKWLSVGYLWPCLTPVTILQQIRSSAQQCFGRGMKEAFIEYGVLITHLQKLLRIYDAVRKQDTQRLRAENDNRGHENWEPADFPDWLLMEIDANILIRQTQVDVARATIMPISGSNSVLQMNMGQGKTSVVTPIVLSALANGRTLVRLVVPESLLLQTAQMLQSRLGDLVGREVLHIPFARKSPVEPESIREYRALHEEMLEQFGVILTVPQHVLSFRLNGFQCIEDSRFQSADAIFSTHAWMMDVCRDVIDECDFSLAVKTQLIYPSGSQALVDGHPQRWKTAHLLLGMLETVSRDLQVQFPSSIDVIRRPNGGFPIIHILRPEVEGSLLEMLVDELCSDRSPILSFSSKCDPQLLKRFILDANVEGSTVHLIKDSFADQPTTLKTLFLLRGLVGREIVLLCLKKRWNVQYGLHRNRSPIAVPFLAKGVPSEQAEWGHPDVAIVLTCLAFYYDGLSLDQLQQCLHSLSQADDPSNQYSYWVSSSDTLPQPLRHWNLINIDDRIQMEDIWPHVRYNTEIVNFFLDAYVFPEHAKQFSKRLQMSGWDLPLFDLGYRNRNARQNSSQLLTTGFSGTNDDRFMLPLTIQQNDLSALSHTNAEVLTYLLHDRNRQYMVAATHEGKHFSEVDLLYKLHELRIRTLIDAGAHILELDNRGLVQKWLAIDHQAPAAVYFDASNKPWVVDRNETEVPLLASSFANDLGNCLVYLDEAHTRGTDLKFPPTAQGALTLSVGQTKDHTVQAAMRLRELGTSQSVYFVASPEAHQSILDHRKKGPMDDVDSSDVVSWLLDQTCRHHEQLRSLYLAQGYDFCHRMDAESSYRDFLKNSEHRQELMAAITQLEQHALEEVYAPRPALTSPIDHTFKHARIAQFAAALDQEQLGSGDIRAESVLAFAEVEQEREVMMQIEQVQDIQRPPSLKHRTFPGLHGSIKNFVVHGHLERLQGYEPAFSALRRTGPGQKYGIHGIQKSRLFVSSEFTRAADTQPDKWLTDFLRPVHWVLWSPATETALIVIPEEVECIVPLILGPQSTAAHLLIYAAPFTKGMLHFNSLDFYALPALPHGHRFPSVLHIELGILAGRLYCSYNEYQDILRYLEPERSLCKDDNWPDHAPSDVGAGPIAKDTLGFLQEWLSMTRKGREFSHTPMGYICRNRGLKEDHPLFAPLKVDVSTHEVAFGSEEFE